MILRSVGVLSVGKIMGAIYAIMGFFFGAFVTLLSLTGAAVQQGNRPGALPFAAFGALAIVMLPVFYGILGFLGGVISAAIYNFVAGFVGGIEMEFERRAAIAPVQ